MNDAIDAGGEGLDAAQEAFLTELDTYEFSMGRYSTVVAANRTQMESYDDEEEALAAKTRELKSQDAELKGKLHETVRERAFRTARDEAVRACGEYPSRAESASIADRRLNVFIQILGKALVPGYFLRCVAVDSSAKGPLPIWPGVWSAHENWHVAVFVLHCVQLYALVTARGQGVE